MEQKVLEDLQSSLKALKGAYRKTKIESERSVSQWRWATGRYFSLIPFEPERFRMARGKLLESAPKAIKNCYAFGFDDQGRLCLARSFGADGKAQTEEFTDYSNSKNMTRVYLNAGKTVGKVVEITFADGYPSATHSLGAQGDYLNERYHYNDGRLEAIDVEQFHAGMKKIFTHRYAFTYDQADAGQATRIEADGKRAIAFHFESASSMSGKELNALLKQCEEKLVDTIHHTVCAYHSSRPAYCLALNYGNDPCRGCIPTIGLGLLAEGETITVPSGDIAPDEEWLWNPAEFSNFGASALRLRSSELMELDRQLQKACMEGAEIDLRALCNQVAMQLNKRDWSPLPVSKDFIVYAVDDDLVDLRENLALAKAAMSAGRKA